MVGNTLHGSKFRRGSKHEFEFLTYYGIDTTTGRFFTANKIDCYVDTAKSSGSAAMANLVWVMMTNNKDLVSDTWVKIEKHAEFQIWTDDKYSIASVLKE